MNKFNNKTMGIIFIIILIVGAVSIYYFFVIKDENLEIYQNETERNVLIPYEDSNSETNKEETKEIIVDISGEVKKPGVLELEEGDRIRDAIEEAGGLTEKADISEINLAYKLEDGMKIKIPNKKDNKNQTNQNNYISTDAGEDIKISNSNNSESNSNGKSDSNTKKQKSIININTASQAELETLPGIGQATAEKIIKYREEKGKFNKIEDLKNVKGIGDAKFEKLKDYIKI